MRPHRFRVRTVAAAALLLAGCASPPKPFRIHAADIRAYTIDDQPWLIRCTVCNGNDQIRGIDRYTRQVLHCEGCGGALKQDIRFLSRPVVVVGDEEITDYTDIQR